MAVRNRTFAENPFGTGRAERARPASRNPVAGPCCAAAGSGSNRNQAYLGLAGRWPGNGRGTRVGQMVSLSSIRAACLQDSATKVGFRLLWRTGDPCIRLALRPVRAPLARRLAHRRRVAVAHVSRCRRPIGACGSRSWRASVALLSRRCLRTGASRSTPAVRLPHKTAQESCTAICKIYRNRPETAN